MASQTQVCNLALTYLGMERISSIADPNEQARKLNAAYEPSLRAMLESHPWNFAIKRATLGLLTETPNDTYAYLFQLPSDFIRVIRPSDRDAEYRIEGGKLATDEATVDIEYVAYISDPTKWSPAFLEAFASKLAWELSISITDKEGIWDRFEKTFKEKYSKAVFSDSQQGTPAPLTRNNWIEDRYR